jgi:hypothetical protein
VIEQLFEDVLRPYGPPWRPGQGIDQYDDKYGGMLLEFVRKSVNSQKRVHGPKGPIFCAFVFNPKFNALATTARGYELIALFTGALSHLVAGHHCLLSDPESLQAVGDAKNERLSSDALEQFKNCSPLRQPHHHPKGERFGVATCLAWLSCVFVALHEVGHIVLCHPAYLERKYGVNIYEELPMLTSNHPEIDVAVAFEWEADEYAAITSYQLTYHLLQSGSFRALRPLGVDFAWGLATSMIFLIIARFTRSWTRASRTHPSAFMRYVWSMMSVQGAPECVALNPNTASLQAGFAEVGNWFKRNEVEINSEKEHWSIGDAMQHFEDQYGQVRAVLAKERELLEELVRYRSEKAEEWLRDENK